MLLVTLHFKFNITRLIAVGALLSTVTACGLIMIQALLDYSAFENLDNSAFENYTSTNDSNEVSVKMLQHEANCTMRKEWDWTNGNNMLPPCDIVYPPASVSGTFKAFASIMFAFAGASTFPTIQADMKEKEKFNTAAYIACISKYKICNNKYQVCIIFMPMILIFIGLN